MFFSQVFRLLFALCFIAIFSGAGALGATATLSAAPTLPDTGPSVFRVFGALILVVGLFLGGAWLFRNGRQFAFRKGRVPLLKVIESRSLGGRHALYVISCEQQRFLVASSPAGINLLSQLEPAAAVTVEQEQTQSVPVPTFAESLALVLKAQTGFGFGKSKGTKG